MKKTLIQLAAICSLAGSASAAVILDASQSATGSPVASTTVTITTAGFDATSSDKLVIGLGGRTLASITSVTYGGVALTSAVGGLRGQGFAGLYYLDNPMTDGDVVFTFNANVGDGYAYGFFALSGTAAGGPLATATSGSDSLATTTLAGVDGGFLINATAIRGSTFLTTTPAATGLFNAGNARGGGAYWTDTSTGTDYISSIGGTNQTNDNNYGVSASFAAIPEPSSVGLAVIGGLLFIRRRR